MSALPLALVTPIGQPQTIEIDVKAQKRRDDLLAEGSVIKTVSDALDQSAAVEIMRQLRIIEKEVEDARTTLKKPLLELGKTLDDTAKKFAGALGVEYSRLSRLVSDFQSQEQRRQQAEAEAQRKEMERINRENAEKQRAQEVAQQQTLQASPFDTPPPLPPPPKQVVVAAPVREIPKADGMVSTDTIEFEILNLAAVYAHFPEIIKLELNVVMAKQFAKAGKLETCPGIKVIRGSRVSVRT